jgi:hypothetical protein
MCSYSLYLILVIYLSFNSIKKKKNRLNLLSHSLSSNLIKNNIKKE